MDNTTFDYTLRSEPLTVAQTKGPPLATGARKNAHAQAAGTSCFNARGFGKTILQSTNLGPKTPHRPS